ncbi:carcinoembryonic antigen-related cell adhesion molecule 1 isoform X2 [Oncorhynchus mykiss]|uniref:carcinoembryonic antigen-related cell adhesion molecule 1 isoform X2 n=1 Tax=Oncorhynchus mykiss TaxID=8022 RepID=UPI00187799E3|nr:carcinoembryonic antigen-related cell adhesion molecule 1 isoform X2 [Oncorhynchus mykiss]
MDSRAFNFYLSLCFHVVGLCYGKGLLPAESMVGEVTHNVTFTIVNPPNAAFRTVAWTANGTNVITSGGGTADAIGTGYVGRITLNSTTGSLELRNLVLSDTGEYAVSISTIGKPDEGTTTLRVYAPVSKMTITANNIDLVEFNSSVSLSCSSSGSSLSYRWLNGSSEFTASDGVQLDDGNSTLTIVRVTRYDQGPFWCIVSNPINSDSESITLTISYGPENIKLKVTPLDVLYGSGSDLTLSCSAESSPPAQFQWALNGELLSNQGPVLKLENIQASQSGRYSCWAHNTRTLRYQTSEPSDITVLERISSAKLTISPNPPIIEGGSVTLTCDASGSISNRDWMKDGQPLSPSERIIFSEDNKTVSISPLNLTDSGIFLCHLANLVSNVNASYNLAVSLKGSTQGGPNVGAIVGGSLGAVAVVTVIGVVAAMKKGYFKKITSGGRTVGNSESSTNGGGKGGNQELNYADITQFQKRDGGSVQLGNLGISSTEYAQVRVNNRPGQPT